LFFLSDTVDTRMLRVRVLDFVCDAGGDACLSEAGRKFNLWLEDPYGAGKVTPDLRSLVYSHGMSAAGDREAWTTMLDR